MARRIETGVRRGATVTLTIDGRTATASLGETLATVLLAEGVVAFNRTRSGAARAPFCNTGTCFECQVRVAPPGARDFRWQRACLYPVADGLVVRTGARLPAPDAAGPVW